MSVYTAYEAVIPARKLGEVVAFELPPASKIVNMQLKWARNSIVAGPDLHIYFLGPHEATLAAREFVVHPHVNGRAYAAPMGRALAPVGTCVNDTYAFAVFEIVQMRVPCSDYSFPIAPTQTAVAK